MSRKSRVAWWEADEPQEAKVKVKQNDEGAPVSFGDGREANVPGGNGIGLFYCGRDLGEDAIPGSDGNCGPYGGPQCPSCKRFQVLQDSRHDVGFDLQNIFNLPGASTRLLQDRVKAKVQQILAGRDLSDTTIGMLRSTLEEKLGLQANALLTTKRLRKWVVQVLEQEVLKKSQRSSKCERICFAIADMETYPDNCRRMLIEALPGAMAHPDCICSGGGDVPHPHQVRILETVEMVLQESLDRVGVLSKVSEQRLETELSKLKETEDARDVAAAAVAAVRGEFDAQEKVLSMAQEACQDAKDDMTNSARKKAQAVEMRETLTKEQERFTVVHRTFLELLEAEEETNEVLEKKKASPSGKKKLHEEAEDSHQDPRQQKLEEVRQILQSIGAERSLVTATIAALMKSKSVRSTFEEVSAQAVIRVLERHSAKLQQDLVTNTTESEDGPIEAAELLHDAMVQNAASKMLVLSEVRGAREKSECFVKVARKEAKQQAHTCGVCREERDSLQAKSAELVEVLDIVKHLIVCTDPPSPGPTARGVASSPMDDTQEDTQMEATADGETLDVAMLLGDELINAAGGGTGAPPSVTRTNLENMFDLVIENVIVEQAEEPLMVCSEPPAKKQKLDSEMVVQDAEAEQACADEPIGPTNEGPPAAQPICGAAAQDEFLGETSADLQPPISMGGA